MRLEAICVVAIIRNPVGKGIEAVRENGRTLASTAWPASISVVAIHPSVITHAYVRFQ
jgi:hypothetical protein